MCLTDPEVGLTGLCRDPGIEDGQSAGVQLGLETPGGLHASLRVGVDGYNAEPAVQVVGRIVSVIHSHVIDQVANHVYPPPVCEEV